MDQTGPDERITQTRLTLNEIYLGDVDADIDGNIGGDVTGGENESNTLREPRRGGARPLIIIPFINLPKFGREIMLRSPFSYYRGQYIIQEIDDEGIMLSDLFLVGTDTVGMLAIEIKKLMMSVIVVFFSR